MTNAFSLLTFRAWFKPRNTAPQLIQRFGLNTVVVLYVIFACITVAIVQVQADTPLYSSLLGYLLAPSVFILLAKWVTKSPWIALAKIALLGFVVTMPLSLLSSVSIVPYTPDESNLVLFSFLGLFYAALTVWIIVIQLRLYSTMLDVRKRTAFAIVMGGGAIVLATNLLLVQFIS